MLLRHRVVGGCATSRKISPRGDPRGPVGWAFWSQPTIETPADGFPFGPVTDAWLLAVLLGTGGIFEPLRRVRVVMPHTHWAAPVGIEGDRNRLPIHTGSPQWWVVYLACLSGPGSCGRRRARRSG